MPLETLRADAVKRHPRTTPPHLGVDGAVRFVLRVHPHERAKRRALFLEHGHLRQCRNAIARVGVDWQPRGAMGSRRRAHQFAIDVGQRPGIDADLHERREDAGAVDAVASLTDPPRGELVGVFGEGVRRQELVVGRAVVAGVGEDVKPGGTRQAAQQLRIAAKVGRRALHQRTASQAVDPLQVRQRPGKRRVAVVARGRHAVGANEIDEHVLVRQRDAKRIGGDGASGGVNGARYC